MLRRPEIQELTSFVPELTILCFPSFKPDPKRHGGREDSDTMVAIDLSQKIVLICGSSYAGEMKKSVFSTLNYYLPAQGVMPMHCSANVSNDGKESALFFGLSGTGKTTLSADPGRTLIGDDETGWGPDGIFNFEGGCYAKTVNLSRENEPMIWDATNRFGAILENVGFDPVTRVPDYTDVSKTENTRSAYPLEFIPNASKTSRAGHPKNIIMLTADAFGVMPPIAKLTPEQAMYHFLSGYTAKVAGTEKGLVGVVPEFSTCFGAPFLPRHPSEYAKLLREYIAKHRVDCWLVNSGWRRPPYADQGDAHAAHRRAERLVEERRFSYRSLFRLRGADFGVGRRAAFALSLEDLAGQSRVRQDRARLGRHVPEELYEVREPRRRGDPQSGAGSPDRGRIISRRIRARGSSSRAFRRKPPLLLPSPCVWLLFGLGGSASLSARSL